LIYILTAPIQTGKTTALSKIIKGRNDVGGFLSPTVNELRNLLDLKTQNLIDFESKEELPETISVGRFQFYNSAFEAATHWTLSHSSSNIKNIIVDELGKLELQEKGFFTLARELLQMNWETQNLILVVRDFLLEDIVRFFSIQEYKALTISELTEIFSN